MPEGLKAGELFVDLGIKGGEKTVGTLVAAKEGMGKLASVSLEAKAGILAALFGLEQLMQTSAQFGATLTNFSVLTGLPTNIAQQYMYAARQVGVANEEVLGSFKSLQNHIAQIDINKGLPEGLKLIANRVGGIDVRKIHDLPYLMQKFQQFATQSIPEGVKRWALSSVGMSEGIIAAMEQNAFRPDVFAKAPQYSTNELKNLRDVGVAWSNLWNKVEMQFGRFNAQHGKELVRDINLITTAIFHLIDAMAGLSERMKVLGALGSVTTGIASTLKLFSELIDKLSGKDLKEGDLLYTPPGQEGLPGWKGSPAQRLFEKLFERKGTGFEGMLEDLGLRGHQVASPRIVGPAPQVSNRTEVHQNITHVGDAKDTQQVKDLHRKAAQAERNHAYRQSPANLQGN